MQSNNNTSPAAKKHKTSIFQKWYLIVLSLSMLALAPTYAPNFTWHCIIAADFFLPWKAFNSPWVSRYHAYLISRLPDREELPALEIPLEGITRELLYQASHGYTVPVIIRGGVKDTPAIKSWTNVSWWVDNFGDEPVLVSSILYFVSSSLYFILCIGSVSI